MLRLWFSIVGLTAFCCGLGVSDHAHLGRQLQEQSCVGDEVAFQVEILLDFLGRFDEITDNELLLLENAFLEAYNSNVVCEQADAFITLGGVDITLTAAEAVAGLTVPDAEASSQVNSTTVFTLLAEARGTCVGCDFNTSGTFLPVGQGRRLERSFGDTLERRANRLKGLTLDSPHAQRRQLKGGMRKKKKKKKKRRPKRPSVPGFTLFPTPAPTPTPVPKQMPTSTPSLTPVPTPMPTPTPTPLTLSPSTSMPTTSSPSPVPSPLPTEAKSSEPTMTPLANSAPSTKSAAPTVGPSTWPSAAPSIAPSAAPSIAPSTAPSIAPSAAPSIAPSAAPSEGPSAAPSVTASGHPSSVPSSLPSLVPSSTPSSVPSSSPTIPLCNCTGLTEQEFLTAYDAALQGLRQSGSITSIDRVVGGFTELEPVFCDPNLSDFNTTVVLETLSDVTTASPAELEAVAVSFLESYNNLNALNGKTCDLLFRQVVNATVDVGASLAALASQNRRLRATRATSTPTTTPTGIGCLTLNPTVTPGSPTESPSASPSAVNPTTPSPNALVPCTEAPTAQPPGVRSRRSLVLRIKGRCRGCRRDAQLYDDVSARRYLEGFSIEERKLQNTGDCLCPVQREIRAPAETEFLNVYNNTISLLIQEQQLQFIEELDGVIEVQEVPCPTQETPFSTTVVLNILGDISTATPEDIILFQESFRIAYNELNTLNLDTCDLSYRRVTTASVDLSANIQDAPSSLGVFSAVVVHIVGSCDGCDAETTLLFEESTLSGGRRLESVRGNRHSRLGGRRQQENEIICFCPTDPEFRAPSEEEFRIVFNDVLDELHGGALGGRKLVVDFVSSVEDVNEVTEIPCPTASSNFESSMVVEFDGDVNAATPEERADFGRAYMDSYNSLNGLFGNNCDPFSRRITSVTIVEDGSLNQIARLGIFLRVSGSCAGCDPTSDLFDVSVVQRQLQTDRQHHRGLQPLTGLPVCFCPRNFVLRAPTIEEFGRFNSKRIDTLQSLGLVGFKGLGRSFEVNPIPCSPLTSSFRTTVFVDFVISGNGITDGERKELEGAFMATYNDLSVEYCDSFFRSIELVTFVFVNDPTVLFLVDGQCRGCASDNTLFDVSGGRQLGSVQRNGGRRLQSDARCFCDTKPVANRAPTEEEFLVEYRLRVEGLQLPNVVRLVSLDENPVPLPSSAPTETPTEPPVVPPFLSPSRPFPTPFETPFVSPLDPTQPFLKPFQPPLVPSQPSPYSFPTPLVSPASPAETPYTPAVQPSQPFLLPSVPPVGTPVTPDGGPSQLSPMPFVSPFAQHVSPAETPYAPPAAPAGPPVGSPVSPVETPVVPDVGPSLPSPTPFVSPFTSPAQSPVTPPNMLPALPPTPPPIPPPITLPVPIQAPFTSPAQSPVTPSNMLPALPPTPPPIPPSPVQSPF